MEKMYTAQQLAEYLAIHPVTLTHWRLAGKGPRYVKVGGHYRYRSSDVERWLDESAPDDRGVNDSESLSSEGN
jgi:excisionase family DNA binding protein